MIKVTSLTKCYGETVAVDDLSFTVRNPGAGGSLPKHRMIATHNAGAADWIGP